MASKIPGWFKFGALYDSVVATVTDGATIVEVGCWKGRSAYDMASKIRDSGKRIRFVCVDHWHGSDEAEHREDPRRPGWHALRDVPAQRRWRAGVPGAAPHGQCEAAAQFADGSCDFVMLDAGHDYGSARADIAAWWPKIRPTGQLAGDDYAWPGVERAVQEAFGPRACIRGKDKRRYWVVRR